MHRNRHLGTKELPNANINKNDKKLKLNNNGHHKNNNPKKIYKNNIQSQMLIHRRTIKLKKHKNIRAQGTRQVANKHYNTISAVVIAGKLA